jgi:hypothetical protein
MIYWLILIVYGIGTNGFTVTTQVMHVGNYSDLKTCQAVAKDSQGSGSPDNWRSNYLRSSVRRQVAASIDSAC